MKKIYVLALVLGAFSFSVNAQSEGSDNFDSYNLGPVSAQAAQFRNWSGENGGTDDADVTDDEAFSPSQSLLIGGNGLSDIIAMTPSAPFSGIYTIEFMSYIPTGKSGYFNMQAALTPEGSAWAQALMGGNVYFNCDGASGGSGGVTGVTDCSIFDAPFSYPEDEWFKVDCVYSLDAQTWSMYIDNIQVVVDHTMEFGTQVFIELAGLDLYSASADNQQYFDDFDFYLGDKTLGVNSFAADKFSVYPNPVKDVLNIKSKEAVDNVTVYDILGKVVLQSNPGTVSPSINMGDLASGSYLVQVTINGASNTVKILK